MKTFIIGILIFFWMLCTSLLIVSILGIAMILVTGIDTDWFDLFYKLIDKL